MKSDTRCNLQLTMSASHSTVMVRDGDQVVESRALIWINDKARHVQVPASKMKAALADFANCYENQSITFVHSKVKEVPI